MSLLVIMENDLCVDCISCHDICVCGGCGIGHSREELCDRPLPAFV